MQCDVCGGVIYTLNKSKYLKTDIRYARAVKTNRCNFTHKFIRGFPSNLFVSFHITNALTNISIKLL